MYGSALGTLLYFKEEWPWNWDYITQRQRETDRERERQTDRQIDAESEREQESKREREGGERETERERETDCFPTVLGVLIKGAQIRSPGVIFLFVVLFLICIASSVFSSTCHFVSPVWHVHQRFLRQLSWVLCNLHMQEESSTQISNFTFSLSGVVFSAYFPHVLIPFFDKNSLDAKMKI